MADTQKLQTAEGREIPGYLNASAGPGKPALIVVHEWWGLNAQIRATADRYAKEGFNVFAADLYHGQLATDAQGAERLMNGLDWGRAMKDLGDAVAALRAKLGEVKVGITGFCMGGAVTLAAASNLPNAFAAAVPYYGIPPGADLSKIRAKVLGHFANVDDWCSPDRVNQLEQTLKGAGVQAELHRYDAQHAFANEQRPEVYSKKDAELAWQRSVAFLRNQLQA
jgi:carboxymethylenebutenolidase